jgi:hypothetical protein
MSKGGLGKINRNTTPQGQVKKPRVNTSSNNKNGWFSKFKATHLHKKDPLKDKFIDDLLRTPEFKHMKREDLLTKSKIYLYSISKSEEEIRIDTELMKTLEKEMIELLPEFETMSKIPAYSEQIGPIIRDIIRMEEKLKTPTSVNLTISRNKLEQLKTDILETINKCKSIIDK